MTQVHDQEGTAPIAGMVHGRPAVEAGIGWAPCAGGHYARVQVVGRWRPRRSVFLQVEWPGGERTHHTVHEGSRVADMSGEGYDGEMIILWWSERTQAERDAMMEGMPCGA